MQQMKRRRVFELAGLSAAALAALGIGGVGRATGQFRNPWLTRRASVSGPSDGDNAERRMAARCGCAGTGGK